MWFWYCFVIFYLYCECIMENCINLWLFWMANRYFMLIADQCITKYCRFISVFFLTSIAIVFPTYVSTDIFFDVLCISFWFPVVGDLREEHTYTECNLLRCWLYAVRRRVACFRADTIRNTHLVVFEVYVPRSVSQRLNKDTLYTLSR